MDGGRQNDLDVFSYLLEIGPETAGEPITERDKLLARLRDEIHGLVKIRVGDQEYNSIRADRARLSAALRSAFDAAIDNAIVRGQSAIGRKKDVVRQQFPRGICLAPNESLAVSLFRPKSAALCFDRVWSPWAPAPVSFWGGSDAEVEMLAFLTATLDKGNEGLPDVLSSVDGIPAWAVLLTTAMPNLAGDPSSSIGGKSLEDFLSRALSEQIGLSVPVVFASQAQRVLEYKPGRTEVIAATLTGLQVLDEASTPWEQILEFRGDADCLRKYRRFVHWLDKDMVGKPQSFVEDAIAERLEDYNWAIRKHKLATVQGVFASMLNQRTLIASAAASAAAAVVGGQLMATLCAIGVILGEATLFVAKELLDLKNLERSTTPEIAFVHEAKQQLAKEAG